MTATVVTSENAAEFYAAKSAPTPADVVATETVEPTKQADEGEQTEVEETAQQQEEAKPESDKLQKRFSELTKQREDAKREAAAEREAKTALEAQVREMQAKLNPPAEKPAESDGKPQPGQFTDMTDYVEALSDWKVENALKQRDQQVVEQGKVKEWTTRLTAAKAEIPDYDEVMASSTVQVSNEVRDAIIESDVGPQLAHYLASNPDVAEALKAKSPSAAMREIGRLEAKLSGEKAPPAVAKPVETPSRAPAPITPIKATKAADSPIGADGEFHGSYAAWKEARRAGKIK